MKHKFQPIKSLSAPIDTKDVDEKNKQYAERMENIQPILARHRKKTPTGEINLHPVDAEKVLDAVKSTPARWPILTIGEEIHVGESTLELLSADGKDLVFKTTGFTSLQKGSVFPIKGHTFRLRKWMTVIEKRSGLRSVSNVAFIRPTVGRAANYMKT